MLRDYRTLIGAMMRIDFTQVVESHERDRTPVGDNVENAVSLCYIIKFTAIVR